MSIKISELIFFITYRCNFECKSCFYADHMNKSIRDSVKELNIGEIAKVSSSMGSLSRLLLSGGEPTLRDDLPDICNIFYKQNRIKSIHLPTNGFYPDKVQYYTRKILERCPGIKLNVSLSLDGLEEMHDRIKGIQGSFEKAIESIRGLAALKTEFSNLYIYVITVVNKINVNEVVRLAEFIKDSLPIDGHGPSPMRGTPYDKGLFPPSYEEWDRLSRQLMNFHRYWNKRRATNRFKAFLDTNRVMYLYNIYSQVLKDKKMPFRCQAGKIIAVLEPNGDAKLCELTEVVGNVRNNKYDFKKTLFSDKANDIREKIRHCACTHACFLEPSIKMNPLTLFRSYLWGR